MNARQPAPHLRGAIARALEYYEERQRRAVRFPEATAFYRRQLGQVRGDRVLNLGCGPTLLDYLAYFGEQPSRYVGLDIDHGALAFVRQTTHPRIARAWRRARAGDVAVELVTGDARDGAALRGRGPFDIVLGVGFFGVLGQTDFCRVLANVRDVLARDGSLLIISWYACALPDEVRARKRARGDVGVGSRSPDQTVAWAKAAGFDLGARATFELEDAAAYGWGVIQSCRFGVSPAGTDVLPRAQ